MIDKQLKYKILEIKKQKKQNQNQELLVYTIKQCRRNNVPLKKDYTIFER